MSKDSNEDWAQVDQVSAVHKQDIKWTCISFHVHVLSEIFLVVTSFSKGYKLDVNEIEFTILFITQ